MYRELIPTFSLVSVPDSQPKWSLVLRLHFSILQVRSGCFTCCILQFLVLEVSNRSAAGREKAREAEQCPYETHGSQIMIFIVQLQSLSLHSLVPKLSSPDFSLSFGGKPDKTVWGGNLVQVIFMIDQLHKHHAPVLFLLHWRCSIPG